MSNAFYVIESSASGGGALLLERARERGYETHFVARSPDTWAGRPDDPRLFADQVHRVDTLDTLKLLHFFDGREAAAVVSPDDLHMIGAALVSEQLGLASPSVASVLRAHFKDRARAMTNAAAGGGAAVRFAIADLEPGTEAGAPPVGLPCIIKPIDMSCSVGVAMARTLEEYAGALDFLRGYRVSSGGYRLAAGALVERFVDGEEYSAELAWDRKSGDWTLIGFTAKAVTPPPARVEAGHIFPWSFGPERDREVESAVRGWLKTIGLSHGIVHVEFKINGDGIHLIEINPRVPGDRISDLVLMAAGVDLWDRWIDVLTDRPSPRPVPQPQTAVAGITYLIPTELGVVEAIEPPSDLPATVVKRHVRNLPADFVGVRNSGHRMGWLITAAASRADAVATAEAIRRDSVFHYRQPSSVAAE